MGWNLWLSVFGFIFLASLPGRTTFLILVLAGKAKPSIALPASIAAFICQAAISVALGNWAAQFAPAYVKFVSGILFLFFSFKMGREKSSADPNQGGQASYTLGQIFLAVFVAEWGDVSQLAIASAAAQYKNPVLIWTCGSVALALTAVIAVGAGSRLGQLLAPRKIHNFSVLLFTIVGLYFLLQSYLCWPS